MNDLEKYYYVKASTVKLMMDALRALLQMPHPEDNNDPAWEQAAHALHIAESQTGDEYENPPAKI